MRVALLAGGTGGAKMAHGFQQVLAPGELSVILNVADDTELWGLHVSPDVDSVLYTLAGLLDTERGWGVAGDTWTALTTMGRYGEETWFRIGDADLATHTLRTRLMREGRSLTEATAAMRDALGVPSHLLPATDQRVRTIIETDDGPMEFQAYFVGRAQEPEVRGVRFDGIDQARPTGAVLDALASADLVAIAPSNPLVSIVPILAIPGMRDAIAAAAAPKIAVSPIIAGKALKGPADRMLASLGHQPTAIGVARIYAGLVDRFVLDQADAALAPEVTTLGMRAEVLPTVMLTDADRAALARSLVAGMLAG